MKLTKFCRYCQTEKPLDAFAARNASPDGLAYKCRDCEKEYRAGRKAEYKALRRASYEKSREQENARALAYYHANRDEMRAKHLAYMERTAEQQRRYRKETKDEFNARTAKRRAALDERTPPWLTREHFAQMQRLYKLAKEIGKTTGEPQHVDHIVPLRGRTVSGLHVPWNLRVVPAVLNIQKGNRHE